MFLKVLGTGRGRICSIKRYKISISAPAFGPNTEFLSGKNLILCETSKNDPSYEKVKSLSQTLLSILLNFLLVSMTNI